MSTKSSQTHADRTPFQARHKVIVVTVVILGIAWLAWNVLYTRVAANAPTPVGQIQTASPSSGAVGVPAAAPAAAQ